MVQEMDMVKSNKKSTLASIAWFDSEKFLSHRDSVLFICKELHDLAGHGCIHGYVNLKMSNVRADSLQQSSYKMIN
jgi:hypothetical protein